MTNYKNLLSEQVSASAFISSVYDDEKALEELKGFINSACDTVEFIKGYNHSEEVLEKLNDGNESKFIKYLAVNCPSSYDINAVTVAKAINKVANRKNLKELS